MNHLISNLEVARRSAGLSQRGLAARVGCTASYISYAESGARRFAPAMAHRVAAELDTDPEALHDAALHNATRPAGRTDEA